MPLGKQICFTIVWGCAEILPHIAATMYSLEDLLNTQGKYSVTSSPCIWVKKKTRANTKLCKVKDLEINLLTKKENVNTFIPVY